VEHVVIKLPERRAPPPARQPKRRQGFLRLVSSTPPSPHSLAATRFAQTCAAIGGTTMLHDLMPDVVTVSFGSRTADMWQRLRQRGWTFVGKGEWKNEPVLGVSFTGDRRANRTADELAAEMIEIAREMEVAATRLW
jgi:hypothetical protein